MTEQAVEGHHSRIRAIVEAAREELGWRGPDFVSVLRKYRQTATAADKRCRDPLTLRVTKSKRRSVWSLERMEKLFTSPIYTGSFSEHRRWRPGRRIVRDAMYWLPLIQLTMGPRPEDAAALPKDAVVVRDGIFCFRFEERPDAGQKTESSERLVPIPDVLIRRGIIDWWREQLALPGLLLFPELPLGHDGKLSDIFGKRRTRIFARLGLTDPREDFYAGRMTVSTQLLALGAPDKVRQSIIGHEHDTIINRHYTQANLALMKSYLDRIDLGLVIEHDSRYRFPVIRGCKLLKVRPLSVTLTLDRSSEPDRIEVHDPSSGATRVISAESKMGAADPAAVYANLESMGRRLARALGGKPFRIEGLVDAFVERKLESLLAVGTDPGPASSDERDESSEDGCSAGSARSGYVVAEASAGTRSAEGRITAHARPATGVRAFGGASEYVPCPLAAPPTSPRLSPASPGPAASWCTASSTARPHA